MSGGVAGRHRLHRLQRGDLSEPHRAVRASGRCRPSRPTCPSPSRSTTAPSSMPAPSCRPVRAEAQPAAPALLVDDARPPALLPNAPRDAPTLGLTSLGDYLDAKGYGAPSARNHLYPMAAAIWSTPAAEVSRFPAARLHPLLRQSRPAQARHAPGLADGRRRQPHYVEKLTRAFAGRRPDRHAAVSDVRRARRQRHDRGQQRRHRRLRPRRHRHPCRPGAAPCWSDPTPQEASAARRLPLHPPTRRCCTATTA